MRTGWLHEVGHYPQTPGPPWAPPPPGGDHAAEAQVKRKRQAGGSGSPVKADGCLVCPEGRRMTGIAAWQTKVRDRARWQTSVRVAAAWQTLVWLPAPPSPFVRDMPIWRAISAWYANVTWYSAILSLPAGRPHLSAPVQCRPMLFGIVRSAEVGTRRAIEESDSATWVEVVSPARGPER